MWTKITGIVVIVGLLAVSGLAYLGYSAPIESESQYQLVPQFTAGTKTFYCSVLTQGEPECTVAVSDTDKTTTTDLGITLDVGAEATGLVLSPDKAHVLVILPTSAIIINTNTFEKTVIATLEDTRAFGVYNEFPAFSAVGTWKDNSTVELSVFSANTPQAFTSADGTVVYPKPLPVSKKTISI